MRDRDSVNRLAHDRCWFSDRPEQALRRTLYFLTDYAAVKMQSETWLQTAMRPDIVRRAVRVAIIVGTILALINHGDRILTLTLDSAAIAKILLTYLVPYGVSTWSAVQVARGSS